MKAYNEYMNKISVSDSLHQKLVACSVKAEHRRHPIMVKRYAATFACLAVILAGVFAMPQLMQNNVTPTPGDNPSVLLLGSTAPTPSASSKYTLDFNKADTQAVAANIAIPGHFWQELTSDDLKAVFHGLAETHTITATANFSSDENGANLFNIDAHAASASGLKAYIQIAPGEVVLDYGFDSEPKTSDVLGTAVTAGYFETKPNSKGLGNVIYFAFFKLSDAAYYVEIGGAEAEKEALENEVSELVVRLIEGGATDLDVFHPAIPELRNDRLSLVEARADTDFGVYLPEKLPNGFAFEEATRFINQESNYLSAHWRNGMGYIDWRVSRLKKSDKALITSITDTKNYDLALYSIPRSESVPDELRQIVDNPIFRIEDLTLDTVRKRTYEVQDAGDISGPRMGFGVLYGDVLVRLSVNGASAETMFDILQKIKK